jgi:hypothetical protein
MDSLLHIRNEQLMDFSFFGIKENDDETGLQVVIKYFCVEELYLEIDFFGDLAFFLTDIKRRGLILLRENSFHVFLKQLSFVLWFNFDSLDLFTQSPVITNPLTFSF